MKLKDNKKLHHFFGTHLSLAAILLELYLMWEENCRT